MKQVSKKHNDFSDYQLIKLDRQERIAKLNQHYQSKQPTDVIRCLNQINDTLSQLLVELKRIADAVDYLSPPQPKDK